MKTTKRQIKLKIKNTQKYGMGVFADEDIGQGEIVHVLSGERLKSSEMIRRILLDKEEINDPLQVGKRTYIDLDKLSRTFNHNCSPTVGIRKDGEMFALRNINKGEEITYDYSSVIAPTEWEMGCLCGSKKCRKTLGDIRSLSKSQLDFYKKSGAIQDYMKKIVKELEKGNYKIPRYELVELEKIKKHYLDKEAKK
jgi:uncharacterized protein